MYWRINVFMLALLLVLSCGEKPDRSQEDLALFEISQLPDLPQEEFVIIDFRKPEAYAIGHIPGALNLWRSDIEDRSYAYRGMLAGKEEMEAILGNLGISNQDKLLLYDEDGLPGAARLWWALKHYGFPDVSLLNGGLQAWKEAGRPMDTKVVSRVASTYTFPKTGGWDNLITKEELLKLLKSGQEDYVILDARSKGEFLGLKLKSGAAKAGRIPNSVNMDWSAAINHKGNKKFKSLSELERIFAFLGAEQSDKIIVYCHSGVRSSHTYFVLTELLGYKNVWNYDGSWTEWSHDTLPYIDNTNMLVKN
ncbi:MAG: sulfurtransferase [Eudoraea sp.]|nr:sulfurtransferase [Eudoraea sp.]